MTILSGGLPFGGGEGLRRCSFCGRRESTVEHLVHARGFHICDDCVVMAHEAISSAPADRKLLRLRRRHTYSGDRDQAEQAIERAYETVFDPALPIAERCAAIERGANLTSTMEQVSDRYAPSQAIDVTVDYVRLLGDDEAEVHFILSFARSGPVLSELGHAALVDEGWKVARDTWCRLVSRIGVQCPPAED